MDKVAFKRFKSEFEQRTQGIELTPSQYGELRQVMNLRTRNREPADPNLLFTLSTTLLVSNKKGRKRKPMAWTVDSVPGDLWSIGLCLDLTHDSLIRCFLDWPKAKKGGCNVRK